MPSFFDLQSMLLIEENHAGASMSTHTDNKMLYKEGDMFEIKLVLGRT